ncbi:MAG: DUF547 domain-containing protein [Hellea sp.]
MRRLNSITLAAIIALGVISSKDASAQITLIQNAQSFEAQSFDKFIPRPQKTTRIDYDIWNDLLGEMVLSTGPSARKRYGRPNAITGSRFVRGHASAYRLEGNRIPYSEIRPEFMGMLTEYRKDLERIGTEIDISKLPRNEQLAFWFNLHNAVMVEQLAKEYPVKRPEDLKIGKPAVQFYDAKIIDIKNTKLSLRDIREKIVYANWRNPKVIYGFYLGDIGSPSIQNRAFNGSNVNQILNLNAEEFVNSLRGFHVRNNKQYVSRLYTDVAKFYFPNFDRDVETHIKKYMRDDVKSQMLNAASFSIDRYDPIIADMTAGQGRYKSISSLSSTSRSGVSLTGHNTLKQFVNELVVKREKLKELGLYSNGTVIVEDIETDDGSKPEIE